MNSTTRALGAVAAAALLAACGGDAKPAAKGTPAPSQGGVQVGADVNVNVPGGGVSASVGVNVPGSTAKPGTGSGGTGGQSATPGTTTAPQGGSSTSPSTKPSPTQIDLKATLAKQCVKPGESQTVSFTARPNMKVIVNTGYSDQKDGSVHGGRFTDVTTDGNGHFTATWTVSPAAPPGDASTQVAAVDMYGTGHSRLPFRVALAC